MVITYTNFYTCKSIICSFEVMESNITNIACNGSVSTILPTGQTIEMSSDCWIIMEWIIWVGKIILNTFARELSWDHIMENTETITTTRVSMIVSELTNSLILRADICTSMWSNSMFL